MNSIEQINSLIDKKIVIKRSYLINIMLIMNINDQIQAVIFDVDGTMFDTLPSLSAAANEVLVQAGLQEIPMPLLRSALNKGLMPMFHKAIALQSTPVDARTVSQLESEYLAHYTQHWLSTAPLFAGVSDALATLKSQGLKLGICTNRDRASTDVLLASASIADFFDVIVGIGDAPRPKPAADPLLLVLERLGIPAATALFVGDSSMDACCGQLSQVRFAAHLGGYAMHLRDLFPNVLTFDSYDQLTSWMLDCLTTAEEARHA